jgi:glycosyltransferase involved in cell wall biosynthesis
VLISAFSCIPGASSGSEPAAGWLWSAAAAVHHDVWLLTWDGYRTEVDAALAARPDLPIHPLYVAQPRWLPGWRHDLRGLRVRYLLWQREARRAGRRAHAEVGFDVAHHLTLSSDWMPAGVGGVPGLPLVWGPVGGYSRPAWAAARWLGFRWVLDEAGRRLVTGAFRAVFGRGSARRAALLIAQNGDVATRMLRLGARRVAVEPNVALEPTGGPEPGDDGPPTGGPDPGADRPAPDADAPDRPVDTAAPGPGPPPRAARAVFAGRLVRWKGVAIALRALADPRLRGWTLDLYGDGVDQARLERLRDRLGLGARVRFCGYRDRGEVRRAFRGADLLVLPSLNDSAGWVVAEAALEGCPTVCLDRGGPPDLVRDGAGTAVPMGRGLPSRFATAMVESRRLEGPLHRWNADRLPALIDRWYQLAVGRPSPGAWATARAPDTTSA